MVETEDQLTKRIAFIHESLGTAAIVEQFIDGRELYVGVIGNERLDVFPVWEMSFAGMADNRWKIATERVKWSTRYQKTHGIMTDAAVLDEAMVARISNIAKRTYRALDLSGYARIDMRLDDEGRPLRARSQPEPEPRLRRGLRGVGREDRRQLRGAARSHHPPRAALGAGPHRLALGVAAAFRGPTTV